MLLYILYNYILQRQWIQEQSHIFFSVCEYLVYRIQNIQSVVYPPGDEIEKKIKKEITQNEGRKSRNHKGHFFSLFNYRERGAFLFSSKSQSIV